MTQNGMFTQSYRPSHEETLTLTETIFYLVRDEFLSMPELDGIRVSCDDYGETGNVVTFTRDILQENIADLVESKHNKYKRANTFTHPMFFEDCTVLDNLLIGNFEIIFNRCGK